MFEVKLPGCRPVPLSSYLKALGVLRVVCEQVDHNAKGWWKNNIFHLKSSLDRDQLEHFFTFEYKPTPLVSPWNGGTGFFPKNKNSGEAFERVLEGDAQRFMLFRETIRTCKENPALLSFSNLIKEKDRLNKEVSKLKKEKSIPKEEKKAKAKEAKEQLKKVATELKNLKEGLLQDFRSTLPEVFLKWMDAAIAITESGTTPPPLLGTGGNDGRLEFSDNYLQRLLELMDPDTGEPLPGSRMQLRSALWDETTFSNSVNAAIGQFDPGSSGGPNASIGYEGNSNINRWDFVLMLEGSLMSAASTVRRSEQYSRGQMAFPFTVHPSAAGYGSQSDTDAQKARAEIWMPLWDKPTGADELRYLLSEGRVVVGKRLARSGIDFARAVAGLGVDRGLSAFERYGFFQRSGKAFLATPLGRWQVAPKPNINLIQELDSWLDKFSRIARGKNSPGSFKRANRAIESAIMTLCRRSEPRPWQSLLTALGNAEATMSRSPQTTVKACEDFGMTPLPPLSPRWLEVADDRSAEFRLACALSSLRGVWKSPSKDAQVVPALRGHMVPIAEKSSRYARFDTKSMNKGDVVWKQGSLLTSMIAVLFRRLINAKKVNLDFPPLTGTFAATNSDLLAFLSGRVDYERIEKLLWGLNAIDWWRVKRDYYSAHENDREFTLPAPFSILKLTYLPFGLDRIADDKKGIPYNTAPIRTMAAGRSSRAVELCARRLVGAGVHPLLRSGVFLSPTRARLFAAGVLFPLSKNQLSSMAFEVTRTARTEKAKRTEKEGKAENA